MTETVNIEGGEEEKYMEKIRSILPDHPTHVHGSYIDERDTRDGSHHINSTSAEVYFFTPHVVPVHGHPPTLLS